MGEQAFTWQIQLLGALASAPLLIEGIALSRGARWAFALGIPLPWKTETVDIALPDGIAGDLSDSLERLHQHSRWLHGVHLSGRVSPQ